jgi:hypothetical protein
MAETRWHMFLLRALRRKKEEGGKAGSLNIFFSPRVFSPESLAKIEDA